jgi:hypothetical protein
MSSNKYFDISFDHSFDGKFKAPSWNRTEGVERQLCDLLSGSRDAPITQSQVIGLTRWPKQDVKRWFAVLLSAGVFVDDPEAHLYRWRLARDFPDDRASLAQLIPPIGSTIVSRKQVDNQALSKPQSSPSVDSIANIVDEDYGLPDIDGDDSDDFFSVFSRI